MAYLNINIIYMLYRNNIGFINCYSGNNTKMFKSLLEKEEDLHGAPGTVLARRFPRAAAVGSERGRADAEGSGPARVSGVQPQREPLARQAGGTALG